MQNNIIITVILCVIAFLLGVAVLEGMDRSARSACLEWAEMAETYPGFYLTPAEAEQCAYYQIPVDAPVR